MSDFLIHISKKIQLQQNKSKPKVKSTEESLNKTWTSTEIRENCSFKREPALISALISLRKRQKKNLQMRKFHLLCYVKYSVV